MRYTAPQTKAEFETNVKQFEAEITIVDVQPIMLPDDGFDLVLPELKYSDTAEGEAIGVRTSGLLEE